MKGEADAMRVEKNKEKGNSLFRFDQNGLCRGDIS